MLVHRFLEQSAARTPDAVALIEPQRSITYGDLDRLANRFAQVFVHAGIGRGDRVVIALENSIELVAAYFGCMKAGAVAVPLPAGPRNDRLAKAIVDCTPAACLVDPIGAAEATDGHPLRTVGHVFVLPPRAAAAPAPAGTIAIDELVAAAADSPVRVRPVDVDLAAIIYTSGSTGEPRGVMLTHRNIVSNTRSIAGYLRLTARDRVMCVLPFYYVYGLSLLHTHLAVGGSLVIDNRFAFPNVVLNGMRQHRVTGFAGVPSTFALLLHRSNLDGLTLPDLRYVTQAGGGMPPRQVREWLERGPKGAAFYVMYGATEASARLTYLDPAELPVRIGSIGRAIPNVEIRVVREDGEVAAVGEVGELVARGSNISSGYWNNPEETAQKFGPLGYRTGDLGFCDADGYLFLVGRRHDMIKVGAHRVGAKEIEDVLHQHPAVHEAAVIGTAHDILGEAPVAVLVASGGADAEALRAHCHQHLAAHKVPVAFHFVSELPKIPGVGKIDKVLLRKTVGAPAAAAAAGAQ